MTDTTWTPTDEQVRIAAEAMEDAALEFIGRDRRVGPGDIARAALVAVGPHIAAQALRDAASAVTSDIVSGRAGFADSWLHARADQIEKEAGR